MTALGFWRDLNTDNRRMVVRDEARISTIHYLFPQGGGPRGSFATFTNLAPNLRSRDVIFLSGVLREQAICPVGIYDVLVAGAANRPRQATSGGVATGGGASWLAPTSPVALTPLIQVIEQGWTFENIQFAPVAGSSCIRFRRRESATIPDSSHGRVTSCYFSTGGAAGMGIDLTETKRVHIEDCDFEALDAGGAGTAIGYVSDGGFGVNNYHRIVGNRFQRGNTNDIKIPTSDSLIQGNVFYSVFGTEGGFRVDLDGGFGRNRIIDNWFADVTAQYAVAGGFRGAAATDIWRNWVADAVDPIITDPA